MFKDVHGSEHMKASVEVDEYYMCTCSLNTKKAFSDRNAEVTS